jgi:putative ABC transport system substrate-binding protein
LSSAGLVLLSSACGLAPSQARAKIPRLGFLGTQARDIMADRADAFLEGLRELGYVEGQTITIDWRFTPPPAGEAEFAPVAAELVALEPDVIFVDGGNLATHAVNRATSTIPIVTLLTDDPSEFGFAASIARPAGNLTGLVSLPPDVYSKCLDLLREVVPGLSLVAVFLDPSIDAHAARWDEVRTAAAGAGIQLQLVELPSAESLDAAFDAAALGRAQALLCFPNIFLLPVRARLAELALQHRLPAITSVLRAYAEAGLAMMYGPKGGFQALERRAAAYIDKILKGAKPGSLPIEMPTAFDLVVNVKTLTALGLTIPPSVATQVTEWIQ